MNSQLDPENRAFAQAIANEPAPHELGYVKAREALEVLQRHEPAPDIVTETIEVNIGLHGSLTEVVIFRPKAATGPCNVVFYSHGGGWILGSAVSFAPLIEDLVRQSGAAIVFPLYTFSDQEQFPFQIEQMFQALEYVVRNGQELNLVAAPIVLAGDSVGGHMSIAMMQMLIERPLPTSVSHMIIFNPVTDVHTKLKSYDTFKDAPFLPAATMNWMIASCIPNEKDRQTALASPLTFLSDEILSKFPSTTIFLSDVDPLVDEGRAFGHRLWKVGVDTAVIKIEGQMHAFPLVLGLRNSAGARAAVELAALKMLKAFSF